MPRVDSFAPVSQSQATQHRSNDAEHKCQKEDGHTDPKCPVGGGVPPVVPDAFEVSRRRLVLYDELCEPETPEAEIVQISLLLAGQVLEGEPRHLAAVFSERFQESNRFAMPRREENIERVQCFFKDRKQSYGRLSGPKSVRV
jgi:hypothetical protein